MGVGCCNDDRERKTIYTTKKEVEQSDLGLKKENEEKAKNIIELNKNYNQLQKEVNNYKKIFKDKNIDLTPEFIQKMMEENAQMKEEIGTLKNKLNDSNLMLLNLINNQNLNNLNNNNNMNNNNFNNNINNNFNNNMNNNNNFNNNINDNNFNNNFNFNGNNINNNMNNNNNMINIGNNINNNFNYVLSNKNYSEKIITIIFRFEGGIKKPISIFNSCRLMDIFYYIVQINNIYDYSDINALKFQYCGHDITEHFLKNDEIEILNLPKFNSVIDVTLIRNVI